MAAGASLRLGAPLAVVLALGIVLSLGQPGPILAQGVGSRGGSFELTDHNGRPFASTALAGRPYAIFFGFTHCPDVCPTTLLAMSNNLASLGADADRLKVLFVTVDPERDTPDRLKQYLASFDPRIIALTGSADQIAATAKGWNAFYNKVPEDGGSYTIAHSAYVYLMDADNRLAGTLGFQESEAEQLAKLRRLIAKEGGGAGN
jgi:protein SCO1/2